MIVERDCDCGKRCYIELDDEEYEKYRKWRARELYIQEIDTLNACEREFLKTGLCKDCQKLIFNNGKSKRIKER